MASAPHVPAGLVPPLEPVRRELQVSNSRFIDILAPAESVEAAREFMQRVKAEFSDATHNVIAFVIRGGATVTEFCSDDGEPLGTAGRPLLAVLRGLGLGNPTERGGPDHPEPSEPGRDRGRGAPLPGGGSAPPIGGGPLPHHPAGALDFSRA